MEYIIDAFNALQIENRIQIITTLITGLGIIISLIISIMTLRQNNKFKREETRASIVCYIDHITKTGNSYIIIKNFGKTIGKVLDVKIDKKIDFNKLVDITNENYVNIFERKNYILAPGQKISSWYDFIDNDIEDFTVTIRYKTLGKIYKAHFLLSSKYVHSVLSIEKSLSSYDKTQNILNKMNENLKEISEKM